MFLRACQLPLLTATAVFLVSCSDKSTPAYNPEVGPFDEDGNYVEAWADNPPKKKAKSTSWKEPATKSWKKPSTSTWKKPKTSIWGSGSWKTKKVVAPEPPIAVPTRTQVVSRPKPVVTPTPRPRPEPVAVRKPTPKPAPVVKPKPKPVKVTPKLRRHAVAKGDTLYSLSRHYGVKVREIQKANGISGTTIRDGQSLTIPAK